MSDIIITPDKILKKYWDESKEKWLRKEISPSTLVFENLWRGVSFEGDVTLERLFEIVAVEPDTWELILQEYVKPLLEEIKKPFEAQDDWVKVDFLEIYWYSSAECDEFFCSPSFHGQGFMSKDNKSAGEEKGDRTNIGVSFSPVNTLKPYKVKLNTKVEIEKGNLDFRHKAFMCLFGVMNSISDGFDNFKYMPWIRKTYETFRTWCWSKYRKVEEVGTYDYTVLEVFKAIFWELTWNGPPQDRDALSDELTQRVEEINSGEVKTIPWSQVKRNIEKKIAESKKKAE